MNILENLDKKNPHHAYLIEGAYEQILPEVIKFTESLGIKQSGNPDFYQIKADSFKVEDARNIKSFGAEKGTSSGKKVFIISANNFLLEAQNTLLKMLEEPALDTHFFIIVPDTNALLPTFISRFYLISTRQDLVIEVREAEKFIAMPLPKRIDFIKELLIEEENEEEIVSPDSARSRSLKFLNALEFSLHSKLINNFSGLTPSFQQIFKVRQYLRQPGSSAKSLMESVALVIPNF